MTVTIREVEAGTDAVSAAGSYGTGSRQGIAVAAIVTWVFGLLLLAIALYLNPAITVAALVFTAFAIPSLWLVWRRLEFGVLALVGLTSGFIPADAIDVRLPVGGLDLRDLVLVSLFGSLCVHSAITRKLPFQWRWQSVTLLTLVAIAMFSTIHAVLFQQVEPNWAFGELRPIVYYASFFLAAFALSSRGRVVVVLVGLFVIADLTAAVLIIQQFLGRSSPILVAMTAGAWNVYDTANLQTGFGAVRLIPPGHVLTYAVSIVSFCLLISAKSWLLRGLLAFQFVYLSFGLILTYTRAQWIASGVALTIVLVLLPRVYKARVVKYGGLIVVMLVLAYGLLGSDMQDELEGDPFVAAVTARAMSLLTPEQTMESDSLAWRVFETEEAFRSVSENPLIGVGLGNVYRNVTLINGEARLGYRGYTRFTRFVHNSYLYLTVKMGLIGLLAFLSFAVAVLVHGWRQYAYMPNGQLKLLVLGLLASFVGLLGWSVTQSHLLQTESTTIVGLAAGIIASASYIGRQVTTGAPDDGG